MQATIQQRASGKLSLSIIRNGQTIPVCKDITNLLLNGGLSSGATPVAMFAQPFNFHACLNTGTNYDDLPGTWTQSGNTLTRATGAGTFPSSAVSVGKELKFQDGERCHVTNWTNTTTVTVSGPARTLTGKTVRRYNTIAGDLTVDNPAGQISPATADAAIEDFTAGTIARTWRTSFPSATAPYSLGSFVLANVGVGFYGARVLLPVPVSVLTDDQLQVDYTLTLTASGRVQTYNLGAEAAGIPTPYTAATIAGTGTYFEIVTTAAHVFAAGDNILLANIVPKRFALASASSTSTTLTLTTSVPHGLNPADSVTVENATLAGYNGTFTVATTPTSTSLTITNAANPGAMGAAGTVRLATPGTYFNGAWTVASVPDSTHLRITSAVTGPAIDPATFTGDPGATFSICQNTINGAFCSDAVYYFPEANVKTVPSATVQTSATSTAGGVVNGGAVATNPSFANDFTFSNLYTWGAGVGSNRIKQIGTSGCGGGRIGAMLTFNCPFTKLSTQRLRATLSFQVLRELP